jgi:uncharacterized protein YodC (DUF2158 family)
VPLNERSLQCPLLKPDGTTCRRGISEGLWTCRWHNQHTEEGREFNRASRREAYRLEELSAGVQREVRSLLDAAIRTYGHSAEAIGKLMDEGHTVDSILRIIFVKVDVSRLPKSSSTPK